MESQNKEFVLSKHNIVWFSASNAYVILDKNSFKYFQAFQSSTSKSHYLEDIKSIGSTDIAKTIYQNLKLLSTARSQKDTNRKQKNISTLNTNAYFFFYNQKSVRTYYNNDKVLHLIASKFFHLKVNIKTEEITATHNINAYVDNGGYTLKNNQNQAWSWQKNQAHLFQGKFSFEILNAIHNKKEQDWIGTFHASCIGNGEQAVMLVGNSGSGKTTLATLLMYAGYDLVADDMSAMLLENNHIAVLPAALSVKEKA
ncbi:hypothetical protein OAA67_04870, partial [Winogradskyella sp.]|nr:hypothetical protein [Winogradskyella sp.]